MTPKCVFDNMVGQERVAGYLETAVRSGAVSHAYLFVGPPGAGKKTAAIALACALVCEDACGACPACHRVKKGFHPDVRVVSPEGAATYMVEQVRDLIHDAQLTPIDATVKVYVLEGADAFNEASANAFLKTLEEPPDDVVFVLLAASYDAVLPTIASRCQVVRFARIPPSVAAEMLVERTGARPEEAVAALAAAGGVVSRAIDFLRSPARRETRTLVLGVMKDLPVMDGHDVLLAARALLSSVKAPLDDLKALQAEELRERKEFLGGKVSTKSVEERHKRELTSREREGVWEVFAVAESWLRDCLAISQGVRELVLNTDAADAMDEVAAAMTAAAGARAIEVVRRARSRVSYNVSPQLATEAMLFEIQEVLKCPR